MNPRIFPLMEPYTGLCNPRMVNNLGEGQLILPCLKKKKKILTLFLRRTVCILNSEISISLIVFHSLSFIYGGDPRSVMVNAMNCGVVVSEFVLQLRYYIHFRTNTLQKGMNPLILPAMG